MVDPNIPPFARKDVSTGLQPCNLPACPIGFCPTIGSCNPEGDDPEGDTHSRNPEGDDPEENLCSRYPKGDDPKGDLHSRISHSGCPMQSHTNPDHRKNAGLRRRSSTDWLIGG